MEDKITIRLTEEHSKLLINLPEQGMGYQIVDIKLKNGLILKNKFVIDSTYLQVSKDEIFEATDIDTIELHTK